MKRILLAFLIVLPLAACVDKAYDLSDIDTDDITIGGDGSVFRAPLATVHVGMDQLRSEGSDLVAICTEADAWLPARLPDGDYVDLLKLRRNTPTYEAAYLTTLLDNLSAQLDTDDEKVRTIARLAWDNPAYKRDFTASVPALGGVTSADAFASTLLQAFRNNASQRALLKQQIRTMAQNNLTTIEVEDIEYRDIAIDLSEDVVDMISENLDPEGTPDAKNTLHLYGRVTSRLPLSLSLEPHFLPTDVHFPVRIDATQPSNSIDESPATQLYGDDLRQIVGALTIRIPVSLEKYYPGRGFDTAQQDQLLIELRLVKRGGLSLNI